MSFLIFLLDLELSDVNNQKGRFKKGIRGQYRVTTYLKALKKLCSTVTGTINGLLLVL